MDEALTTVSHVLSEASHHVGFAVPPQSEEAAFQRIDFVPLTDSKVLVVVVMRGGQVSNKVVDIGERLVDDRPAPGGQLPERAVRRAVR